MTTLQQEKVEECEKSTHQSSSTFAKESEVMRGRGNHLAEKVDRGDQGSYLYDVHRVRGRGILQDPAKRRPQVW